MRLTRIHQIAARRGSGEAARAFYQQTLGARFIAEFDPPGITFFDFSGTRLILEENAPQAVIYFWVDDIQAAHASLKSQGVTFDSEPHMIHKDDDGAFDNPGSEEWMTFFKDPGGNTLALASRVYDG